MEIFVFVFPFLNFLISILFNKTKKPSLIYYLIILFGIGSFFSSFFIFFKLLGLNNDLPIYFYPVFDLNILIYNISLRLDLFSSVLISLITFTSLL